MRDIVIKSYHIRREFFVFLLCLAVGEIVNAISITVFDTSWIELVSQIGYVFFFSVGIYVLLAIIRVVICLAIRTVRRLRKK